MLFGKKKEESKQPTNKVVNKQSNNQVNKQPVKPVKRPQVQEKSLSEIMSFDPTRTKKITVPELYDWMLSNMLAKDLILPTKDNLGIDEIGFDWAKMLSKGYIHKVFIVEKYGNWLPMEALGIIREITLGDFVSVKCNVYCDCYPYTINWDSPKMKDQIRIYERKKRELDADPEAKSVFKARENAGSVRDTESKTMSFGYYNDVDLTYRRSTFKFSTFFQIIGSSSRLNDFETAIANFKSACISMNVDYCEIQADVIEWCRNRYPTSLRNQNSIQRNVPTQILSDDTISALLPKGQGRIGNDGVNLGSDIYSGLPVFHKFREDSQKAENVLITAMTGGGKSVFVKHTLLGILNEGIHACILDFEGDEYTNIAKFLNTGNPDYCKIVNLSSSKGNYFDPLRIADLTGNTEFDSEAKSQAVEFTKAMLRILLGGQISVKEDDILSEIIARTYAEAGVTDDITTWEKSKTLSIHRVYDVLSRLIEQAPRKWNKRGNDELQKVAEDIQLRLKKYFIPGQPEYGTFGNILDIKDIRDAKVIVFSFGNGGRDTQGADQTKLALKQLSVSKIMNEVSNYNYKVKDGLFTLKIWEEVQRFIDIPGAGEIMKNCITGGRKRGDIAFIVTNNLADLLSSESEFMQSLRDNLTGYCVGYIPNKQTREKFCEKFDLQLLLKDLDRIAIETGQKTEKDALGNVIESPFKSAFLVKMDPTSKSPAIKTIVKALIPNEVFKSHIFDPGKLDEEFGG